MRKIYIFTLLFLSCSRFNSYVPEISLEEIGPNTVVEFSDSLYMRISFYDADGDLGENYTNDKNLYVVDERLGFAHEFRISQIVPGSAEVPIQGELEWIIPSMYRTNTNSSQQVVYTIYVIDRAGNQSNTITTPPITIIE